MFIVKRKKKTKRRWHDFAISLKYTHLNQLLFSRVLFVHKYVNCYFKPLSVSSRRQNVIQRIEKICNYFYVCIYHIYLKRLQWIRQYRTEVIDVESKYIRMHMGIETFLGKCEGHFWGKFENTMNLTEWAIIPVNLSN